MSATTARTLEPSHYPNNLPLRLSRFIGRERELAQLKPLMWSSRLLTLTGFGGCGKTRLALKAAEQLLDAFSGGVWLVELAPVSDPALVVPAVAEALGLREPPEMSVNHALIAHLQTRDVLLVLDNCEHLITACAELAQAIVQRCPEVHILATSREALNVEGEIIWQVPPLAEADAAQLFIDRAAAIQSGFAVTDRAAPVITHICQRLDGLPLAIELAAVRIKVLSVDGIAARLDDRYTMLTSGNRTAPPRHQTLRAMIDWSYDLLATSEQTLLRRLAVFAGGWTLAAAEAVCAVDELAPAAVLDLLTRLVDKSLVQVGERAGDIHYSLLETIRQYALEKLQASSEWTHAHSRHVDYYLELVERAEPLLRSADRLTWLNCLDAHYDNIRAALTWVMAQPEKEDERGLRLCGALPWYWHARAHIDEARRMVTPILAGTSSQTLARAKALYAAGWLAIRQGDPDAARPQLEESAAIFRAWGTAGLRGLGDTLVVQGIVAADKKDYALSRAYFEESLQLRRTLDDAWGMAQCLNDLGTIATELGDYEAAHSLLEESLAAARTAGDKGLIGLVHSSCVELLAREGDAVTARPHALEGLTLLLELGDFWRAAGLLAALGELEAQSQQPERLRRAVRLWASTAALLAAHGDSVIWNPSTERALVAVRAELGDEAFEAAWHEGRALSMPEAIDYALTAPEVSSPIEPAVPTVTSLRAAKQHFGGLTARERQVAALVAQGQSNREISETLVISENTVATHLGNILSKLEFDSRTQIVGWALTKGLVKPLER